MKKIFYFFCATLLALTSCNNDDNSNQVEVILPKTVKYTDSGRAKNNYLITITYEGAKIKTATSASKRYDYTYTGDFITKIIGYNIESGKDVKINEFTFTYTDNKLSSSTYAHVFDTDFPNDLYKNKITFTYNSNGTISKEFYLVNSKNGTETKEKNTVEILTYQNGNLVKKVKNSDSVLERSYSNYEFDTKSNPFKNIIGFNLLLDNEPVFGNTNSNNIIASDHGAGGLIGNITYKYIYDNNGFPTEESLYEETGLPVNPDVYEYTY